MVNDSGHGPRPLHGDWELKLLDILACSEERYGDIFTTGVITFPGCTFLLLKAPWQAYLVYCMMQVPLNPDQDPDCRPAELAIHLGINAKSWRCVLHSLKYFLIQRVPPLAAS